MSLIGQVVNINQNMHIPAHIVAEHIASMKFADEFAKIASKQKQTKLQEVRQVEKTHNIDKNGIKKNTKEKLFHHIDLKG